jgi:hypothetical protein
MIPLPVSGSRPLRSPGEPKFAGNAPPAAPAASPLRTIWAVVTGKVCARAPGGLAGTPLVHGGGRWGNGVLRGLRDLANLQSDRFERFLHLRLRLLLRPPSCLSSESAPPGSLP